VGARWAIRKGWRQAWRIGKPKRLVTCAAIHVAKHFGEASVAGDRRDIANEVGRSSDPNFDVHASKSQHSLRVRQKLLGVGERVFGVATLDVAEAFFD
jgi:hypothetical protein